MSEETSGSHAPKLTIGLPTYNGERYLAQALDSLLAQTFTDFELIIADNASTDATGRIAQEYAERDPRIRYVRHDRNRGSAYNHTFVIREARGTYFKWASDDDLYAPDLLERCVAALDARPDVPLAHSWTTRIDEDGQEIDRPRYVMSTGDESPAERLRTLLYTSGGDDIYGVIRTEILAGMRDYGSHYHSDRVFVAEVALHGPFHHVPDHLYFRREHAGQGGSASLSIRRRCVNLDERRANTRRHPTVRLVAEYLAQYPAAIARAPLSMRARLACLWVLLVWMVRHLPTQRAVLAAQAHPEERIPAAVTSLAFYGPLGSGNLGNDASLETALEWFRTHRPGLELSCITIAPRAVRERYGLRSVPLMACRPDLESEGRRAGPVRRLVGRLLDVPHTLRLAGRADVIVIPGMGVLEERLGVRPWAIPSWMATLAIACRVRGCRLALLGVGADEIRHPLTRWLFRRVVKSAHYVSYRDAESALAMAGAGRPACAIGADIAFVHPASVATDPQPSQVVIGVMRYYGPDDDVVAGAAVHERYVAGLADVARALVRRGDRVRLVVGDAVDAPVAERIRDLVLTGRPALADAIVVARADTFEQLTEQMRDADAVIASRYHNLVCALRLGRPVISLDYADKNGWLMTKVGFADLHGRIEDLDPDKLLAQLDHVRSEGDAITARLRMATERLRGEASLLLEDLSLRCLGRGEALAPAEGALEAPPVAPSFHASAQSDEPSVGLDVSPGTTVVEPFGDDAVISAPGGAVPGDAARSTRARSRAVR